MKTSAIFFPLSALISLALSLLFTLLGVGHYDWRLFPLLLTGNYLQDVLISLLVFLPLFMISGLLKLLVRRVLFSLESLWLSVLIPAAGISLLLSFAGFFQGIRGASGLGFLSFVIAGIAFLRDSGRQKVVVRAGLALPFWLLLLIPAAMSVSDISLMHFYD